MKVSRSTGKILRTCIALLLLVTTAATAFFITSANHAKTLSYTVFGAVAFLLFVLLLLFLWKSVLTVIQKQRRQSQLTPGVLNTELEQNDKNPAAALNRCEKYFSALLQNNEDLIITVDEKYYPTYMSASAVRCTGYSYTAAKQKTILTEVHPDDAPKLTACLAEASLKQEETIPLAFRFMHSKGHYIWLEGTCADLSNDSDIASVIINLRDVTASREAAQKIIKLNRLYFFISQINQMIVKVTDEEKLFREACRIAVDVGKFRMAWIGLIDNATKELRPLIHAGEEQDYLSKIGVISLGDTMQSRGPTATALREGRYIVCNDIEEAPEMALWKEAALGRHYHSSIALPIKNAGEVIGAFSVYADSKKFFDAQEIALLEEVTGDISFALENLEKEKSRQKAEEALLASQQRYQTLSEISPVGIFNTDVAGNTIYVNPRWCEISGLKREAALGVGWLKAVYEPDKEIVTRGWMEATNNQVISTTQYRFLHEDGSIAWVLGQAVPELNANRVVVGYVGTITDITEQKKAEEEIKKIYTEKETVLNRINDGVVSVDNGWCYTFLNDAALATHPLSKKEILGKTIWDIHPEMKGTVFWDKYHEAMETRRVVEFENFYAPMDTWFSVKVYPSHNGLTIFYRDVTEKKKTEQKIITTETRLRKAQEIGKLGYWQLDLSNDMVWASKQAMHIYGFPAVEGELNREIIAACIIDREKVKEATFNLVKYNKPYDIEIRVKPANGDAMKYISALAELECNENGVPQKIVGTLQDITERIKNRNEIINEKNLSDSIINSLPGVFYLYNQEGKFLRWNKNFEDITQYEAEEIMYMHPLDFYDTDEKELLEKKIFNTFNTGEDNVQANFLLKNKKKIPYYFTGKAIEYKGSACLMGVGIDFSERVKAQEKIKETTEQLRHLTAHLQSIREEERKRIGREIHDELGQQLTAIKMDVAWIDKKTSEENQAIKSKLKNVIGLLDGSNQSIRRILTELRPAILDDRGLMDAIEWLGRQLTTNTGIPVQFISNEREIKLPEQIATCIFRVYQEALTNIMRYAGAGTIGTSLNVIEDNVILDIKDDGCGFDPATVQTNKSFGILGMQERVFSLGGDFKLYSSPGKGTEICIHLPVNISTNNKIAGINEKNIISR